MSTCCAAPSPSPGHFPKARPRLRKRHFSALLREAASLALAAAAEGASTRAWSRRTARSSPAMIQPDCLDAKLISLRRRCRPGRSRRGNGSLVCVKRTVLGSVPLIPEQRPRCAARLCGFADVAYRAADDSRVNESTAARAGAEQLARAALGDTAFERLRMDGETLDADTAWRLGLDTRES